MVKFIGPEGVLVRGGMITGDQSPALIYKNLTWPQTIPHRAGASLAPENTFAAIDQSIALGFQVIEIDVRLMSDGVLALQHDNTLDRNVGFSETIENLSSNDLAALRVDPALLGFHNMDPMPIPTLPEIFVKYADAPVIWLIEAKYPVSATADQKTSVGNAIVRDVQKYNMQNRVIVQSFAKECVAPAIAAGLPGGYIETAGATTPASLIAEGFSFYGMRYDAPSENMTAAYSSSLRLLVYTVNSRSVAESLRSSYPNVSLVSDEPYYVSPSWAPRKSGVLNGLNFPHGTLINKAEQGTDPYPRGLMMPRRGSSAWINIYPNSDLVTVSQPRWRRRDGRINYAGEIESSTDNLSVANATRTLFVASPNALPESFYTTPVRTTSAGPMPGVVSMNANSGNTVISGLGTTSQTSYPVSGKRISLTILGYPVSEPRDKGLYIDKYGSGRYNAVTMGSICPTPTRSTGYTISCKVRFINFISSVVSAQIGVCMATDEDGYHDDDNKIPCYNALMRSTGVISLYKATGGDPVLLANSTGTPTPISPGEEVQFSVTVTGSTITATRTGANGTVTATATDSDYTGRYVFLGVRNLQANFYDLTIS